MSTSSFLSDFLMSDGILNAQQSDPIIEQPIISPRPSQQTPAQQAAGTVAPPSGAVSLPGAGLSTGSATENNARPLWTLLPGFSELYDFFTGKQSNGSLLGRQPQEWILDAVVVVAGLVLLAGAVFGFRNVSDTVVTTAKKGAEIAAA